jgi:hypothetical protein
MFLSVWYINVFVFFRLVDNIATDETGEIAVDLEELTSKFKNDNKDLNSNTISKFLRRLFPNVTCKPKRSNNDWNWFLTANLFVSAKCCSQIGISHAHTMYIIPPK